MRFASDKEERVMFPKIANRIHRSRNIIGKRVIANEAPHCPVASDACSDSDIARTLFIERFNIKFNRVIIPCFVTDCQEARPAIRLTAWSSPLMISHEPGTASRGEHLLPCVQIYLIKSLQKCSCHAENARSSMTLPIAINFIEILLF